MSRTFWVAVGAVGGIAAYRRGERMARRARELGPLGTAQAVAASTSRAAGRTASGLGRLHEIKARREGRLVLGSAESLDSSPVIVADLRTGRGGGGGGDEARISGPSSVPLVSVR
jgi:hypothetical protein